MRYALLNTDLHYYVIANNLKEEFIIKDKTDFNQLVYNVTTDLHAEKNEEGLILLKNQNDEVIYVFQVPYLYDSAEKASMIENVKVNMIETENGYQITYDLDAEWLNSEERVYPIILDPTVSNGRNTSSIHDTYVHPGDYAGQHVYEERLRVGQYNTHSHALVRWTSLPTISGNILSSHFSFNFLNGNTTWGELEVHRINSYWDSYTVNWNTEESLSKTRLLGGLNPVMTNGYYNFSVNVTNTVRGWYNGSFDNNGFMVKYENDNLNDYNSIFSSDSTVNSDFWPCLWVRYESQPLDAFVPSYYSDILDNTAIIIQGALKRNLGYNAVFSRNPNESVIREHIYDPIVVFVGHGEQTKMFLGDYAITTGNQDSEGDDKTNEHDYLIHRKYIGLGTMTFPTVDLMVFGGCSTARKTVPSLPNLPEKAVMQGVRTSIGWKENIESGALTAYMNEILKSLSNGATILEAVNAANRNTYADNRIKNNEIVGEGNAKITLPYKYSISAISNDNEREAIVHPVDIEITEENKYQIIEKYIQNNINKNFKLNDYKILDYVETNGGLHFTYTPYGIETSNGYTVFIKDNKINEFSEYTEENFEKKYEMLKDQKFLSNEKEEELKNKVLSKSREDYQISIYKAIYRYKDDHVVYSITYDIDTNGVLSSESIEYTLNTNGEIIESQIVY